MPLRVDARLLLQIDLMRQRERPALTAAPAVGGKRLADPVGDAAANNSVRRRGSRAGQEQRMAA